MSIKEDILEFMKNRPEVIGIIGYGSGVNPQKGQEKRKPQVDLIVIVDNLKAWHKQNIELNKKDYSFTSRLFFKLGSENTLKSGAKICYMTYIPFKNQEYKIGTIELADFLDDLNNWTTFYMAGRMHKPILVVKANKEIEKAILENRLYGINATKVLAGNGEIDEKEFYMMFAGLSYIGDTRMCIAENPDKVKNIVLGRLDFYEEVYGSKLGVKEGKIYIKEEDYLLPDSLTKFISNYKGEKAQAIRQFLTEKNKNHSLAQTIKGIFTTGPVKAIKYALAKLKRKKGK